MDEKEIIENDRRYMRGVWNFFIRCYYYLEQGLNVLNTFRNLIYAIAAIAIALKIVDYRYMVIMFLAALPPLAIIGYITVHKVNKNKEWINIRFSTHYALEQFNLTKRIAESLERMERDARGEVSPEQIKKILDNN